MDTRLVTTDRLLEWWAERYPERISHVVATGVEMTYREWRDASATVAVGLSQNGVTVDSFVGIAFPRVSILDFAICLTAVHRLGARAVLLPVDEGAEELGKLVTTCPPACLIVSERSTGELAGLGVPTLAVEELRASADSHSRVTPHPTVSPSGIASVVFTSGTTGLPKGVAIRHGDLMAGAPQRVAELETHPAAGSVHLHAFQLSTAAGQWVTLAPLLFGVRMVTATEFNPRSLMELIAAHQVSEVAMVPAMAAVLRGVPVTRAGETASVQRLTMGTARCPAGVLEHVAALFPKARIHVEYSSTESGAAGTSFIYGADVGSDAVGWPSPGSEVRITDQDGRPVPAGQSGTVELRLPPGQPTRFYVNELEATAATFRGRWVRMADVGYLDDQGCLHLVGRTRDFVNVSGRKVACAEVERVLEMFPGVVEAAVFPLPNLILGEELAAAVVAEDGVTAAALRRFTSEHLPSHKVPGAMVVLDSLPRTRTGKIRKDELPSLVVYRHDGDAGPHDIEPELCRTVSEVLALTRVSREVSLLELGATSLQVLRVYFAVSEALEIDFDVNLLSTTDSLAEIARRIGETMAR